ncbi:hypothetical protein F945_01975 [Acinetobacter rudis CIP 110305]|uniref:HTH tetR-type domain-containing protein n=2 Tax=Acinetobacter rudis TaxID=632955 RepID=S3P4R9_9GAMM|nr:hypothetical protein F945_01975 [Acinetobacter rudis CIP 110305]
MGVKYMARRSKQEMQETRAAILASARKIFSQQGYGKTSMDDLTAQIGLTRGALYHHFSDKKALFEAVVDELDLEMDQRLQQQYESALDPWVGFQARCQLFLSMAQEQEIQRIILQDAPAVLLAEENKQQCVHSLQHILIELIRMKKIIDCDAEVLARFLHGSLTELAFWISKSDQQRLLQAQQSLTQILDRFVIV